MTWAIVQVIGVLGLAFFLAWLLRRLFGTRALGPSGRRLQVLSAVALGPGRSVCLVWAVDRLLIVGSTAQQITLLGEVRDEREIQKALEEPESFREIWQRALRRPDGEGGEETAQRSGRPDGEGDGT